MPHNRPLILKVANRKDFTLLTFILFILVMVSAALSPQAVLLIFLGLVVFGAYTLWISNINDVKLMSVIFPDGQIRLGSDLEPEIEGFLSGQQWCTHHFAILRYITGGKCRYLVLLSAQQNADDYRRLNVWLRQDFCNDTANKKVSASWPAKWV